MANSWTEPRVDLLKKLWAEGLSCSQIAGVLGEGATRNSVIGKLHRLKLSGTRPVAAPRPRAELAERPIRARRITGKGRTSGKPGGGVSWAVARARVLARANPHVFGQDGEMPAAPLLVREQLFIPVEQRLKLLQLSDKTCKWPYGDPREPDFYFCGKHPVDGKPYCLFHHARAGVTVTAAIVGR